MQITGYHADFNQLKYVAKARAGDKSREVLQFIKVEVKDTQSYAYATDGFRLHIAEVSSIDSGLYRVLHAKKTELMLEPVPDGIYFYPDVWPLMPSYDCRLGSFNGNELVAIARINKFLPAQYGMNYKYILDIENGDTWDFYYDGNGGPVAFHGDCKKAYIMPLSMTR